MRRVSAFLLLAAVLTGGNIAYCGTVDPPYEVGTWRGFRSAAVTYTFDDQCSKQFSVALPMFNSYGYKMTFYPVINWGPPWSSLQTAASQGHEVGSHTMSHPSNLGTMSIEDQTYELVQSQNSINSHIPGNQCRTISYPNCNPSNQTLTATYYIAGRICSGALVSATPSNFYQISSIICGSQGSVNSTASFISKFTTAASQNKWCVFLIHGIDNDGGWSPLSSTILNGSLQYLDANRDIFWEATFLNVVKYIKERNNVSVSEISSTSEAVTVSVTDILDDGIYDYPVTIRRPLPAGWSSAAASQDGQPIDSSIVEVSSVKYIMFDAVPDCCDVVLTKVLAVPESLTASAGCATVALDWDDVNDSNLAGYNVYRSASSGGGYGALNGSLLSSSNYEDANIPHDTTFYYVVTAVDTNSAETGYSNEVFGGLYGDFTGNGIVEMNDLSVFLDLWPVTDCNATAGVDLNDDCTVNFSEFSVLADNWQ